MTQDQETRALDIVRPAVSIEQAKAAWAEYQGMKAALASDEDKQTIEGRPFLKKSYWRKVERFYKLNLELLKEWHEDTPEARVFYAMYRAAHPSGAFCDGDGADFAKSIEEFHNARATAHTRAKNRAIADLVGGGEVSAEEITAEGRKDQKPPDPEFWCEKHQAEWFRRGKMTGYAHPIGEKVAGQKQEWCSKPVQQAEPPAAPQVQPPDQKEAPPATSLGRITNDQLRAITTLRQKPEADWSEAELLVHLEGWLGVKNLRDMSQEQAAEVIKWLQKPKQPAQAQEPKGETV